MIEAFVTNLGKYNEGVLCGEYLKLPATAEYVQGLLARIGVDGAVYEEFFITDYNVDASVAGLHGHLGEYESIDELNYLAALLSDMGDSEREKFTAAMEYGEHTGDVRELINLAQNLDCYDFYPGVHDEEDLGYYMIDDLGALEVPEHLASYFDYEAYGRDVSLGENGIFAGGGYIMDNGDTFEEYYDGREDIPDEYRIFAYPDPPDKMPIKDQLEMYGKMAITAYSPDRPTPSREEVDL